MLLDTEPLCDLARQILAPLHLSSVLDLGSLNRPQTLIAAPLRHVCVDPCSEALAQLPDKYERWNMTARMALGQTPPGAFDAIVMLDMIEHVEKAEGFDLIEMALAAKPRVIVVFTPYGYVEQEPVPGMLGGEWQRHRSGWVPSDFRGRWVFLHGSHWQGLDPGSGRNESVPCFFAIWIAP